MRLCATLRAYGMTLTLLHNPHCSTSVYALEALDRADRTVHVRKYLLVAERLSEDELAPSRAAWSVTRPTR